MTRLPALIRPVLTLVLLVSIGCSDDPFVPPPPDPDPVGPPEVGDIRSFRTVAGGGVNTTWVLKPFALHDIAPTHRLWVVPAFLGEGFMTEEGLAALTTALKDQTPPGSFDPDEGIAANIEALFGPPPDVDGDGLIDILIYDLPGTLGGLVHDDDFITGPEAPGNAADVFHLDFAGAPDLPSLDVYLSIAAHEYAHVIHTSQIIDGKGGLIPENQWEVAFIGEGLAQYSMVATGWPEANPPDSYADADELALALLPFRGGGVVGRKDYFRAGLFHLYLAEQFGTGLPRALMANSAEAQGADNLAATLNEFGSGLESAITAFHLANYLNDPDLDVRYGYTTPGFQTFNFRDVPDAHSIHVDGMTTTETTETRDYVGAGGVQFLVWEHVSAFTFTMAPQFEEQQADLRLWAVLERPDGSIEVQGVTASMEATSFPEAYERITLAVLYLPDGLAGSAGFDYAASWSSG